jgi:hypothetical protein
MKKNFLKSVAIGTLSGVALLSGIGVASAQTSTAISTASANAAQHRPARSQNGGFAAHAPAIAKALGMTTDDLRTAQASGKTIAQLASEKGVNLQTILATYVSEEQAEHPEMTAAVVLQRVTDSVNGVRPAAPDGARPGRSAKPAGVGTNRSANAATSTVKA